jgi:hypothetical protein
LLLLLMLVLMVATAVGVLSQLVPLLLLAPYPAATGCPARALLRPNRDGWCCCCCCARGWFCRCCCSCCGSCDWVLLLESASATAELAVPCDTSPDSRLISKPAASLAVLLFGLLALLLAVCSWDPADANAAPASCCCCCGGGG